MRILGIGSLDYFFPDTSKHHAMCGHSLTTLYSS